MKFKDFLYIIIVGLVLLVLWLFLDKKQRAEKADRIIKRLRKENYEIKTSYLNLFEKYLNQQKNVDVSLVNEVKKLKENVTILDFEVQIELENIIKDLNNGDGSGSVRRLAKVVEYKLKEKAKSDTSFKGKPMLHNLLIHALDCKWITSRQYENAQILKEIRNKESHEIIPISNTLNIGLSVYSGIDILYSIN